MTRLAVMGAPIAHSRSPLIHRAAYAELGLDWHYGRVRCGAAGLERFVRGRDAEWLGLSLTMPLKEEAHRLASTRDPFARESGVVNTLRRRPDGSWDGFNTDVLGLASAMRDAGFDARRTLVLGSGATAVSAVLAARTLGAETITVAARNAATTRKIIDRFNGAIDPRTGVSARLAGTALATLGEPGAAAAPSGTAQEAHAAEAADDPTMVISTLPGHAAAQLNLPDGLVAAPLFDVAYDPWPSPLAARWSARGGEARSGLGMLAAQAILQIRIFLSGSPEQPLPGETRVRDAIDRALASSGVGG